MIQSIQFQNDSAIILDQTKLPDEEIYKTISHPDEMIAAIKNLEVRGAPLIGVSAAYGIVLAAILLKKKNQLQFSLLLEWIEKFRQSRPTAVNLMWACDQMKSVINSNKKIDIDLLSETAAHIHNDDIERCKNMGEFGSSLFEKPLNILTHCNTGFLATAGQGTALSVIFELHKKGLVKNVWVDETRPLLQGGRLTAWELKKSGIPYTGISDSMAASVMDQKKVDVIFTGADRVAANGDSANKIGTLGVAVIAKHFGIPFYIVAPTNTIDFSIQSGKEIPIEERKAEEVLSYKEKFIFPKESKVYNPAFDVTPNELISGIITDRGIAFPKFEDELKKLK